MKTRTLIIVCLLLGIGLTQLSAQNSNSGGTKSVVYDWPVGFYTEIWCDGVFIDYIEGEAVAHVVDHYKNYEWQWEILNKFTGTATGLHGDIYTFSEIDKWDVSKENEWICHTHVKASNKAIYNVAFIINTIEWTAVTKVESCTGNLK